MGNTVQRTACGADYTLRARHCSTQREMLMSSAPMKPLLHRVKRLLTTPLVWLAALVFLVEEFLWDWTARLMARLGAVKLVHAIERRIAALPPRWAFFAFILPSTILIPAKLIGLHALAAGHWLLGSTVFLLAKVAGMALFSRIFNLTRPALMTLPWFSRFYAWVMHYRDRIHDYLDHWATYQRIKRTLHAMMASLKTWARSLFTSG